VHYFHVPINLYLFEITDAIVADGFGDTTAEAFFPVAKPAIQNA
jgi:hypothetical protein